MDSHDSTAPQAAPAKPRPSVIVIIGYVISALVSLLLFSSAIMKFLKPEFMMKDWERFGWLEEQAFWIGLTELACVVIYAVPQTSVLGAILLTGYLGGATATHVRLNDPFVGPIIIGVVVWAGLFLRDARIRALIPIKW